MWDPQERDGHCEVGTGQKLNPLKDDDDDDDDDDSAPICLILMKLGIIILTTSGTGNDLTVLLSRIYKIYVFHL
jgi:hypothetical protein